MTSSDRKSWTEFFSRERDRLIRYVRGLIADAGDRDSEDIVQDVIAGLFDKTDITAPIENFAAYIYQALRNRVVDQMRRRRKYDRLDAELPGDTGMTLLDILEDLKFDTAAEAQRNEINSDISRAIGMLDEKSRLIVLATERDGSTFGELSEEWDLPIGTLLARKSRAMKKLREALLSIDSVHYSSLVTERTVL